MDIRQPQLQGDTIRQELLKQYNRATTTSADDVDLLAIDLFATMVQQYESVITFDATKIIALKFKSSNADEVLLALNVLEECMSKCGARFRAEVGKFRFLNELIRLVSPQYDGEKTPKKIRDIILDLMLLWSKTYPDEKKIKEAYDMLLKRGVKHEYVKAVTIQNSNKNNGKLTSIVAKAHEKPEDELASKLKGLIDTAKSNPANFKAANLLIQNMVKENERRHEVKMRRKLELKEITENASLLQDMLREVEAARSSGSKEDITEDELVTMKYLYESCKKLQPTLLILLGDTDECLEEAFEANDLVTEVFQKYHQLIIKKSSNSCLISTSSTSNQNGKNTMDELTDIFTNNSSNGQMNLQSTLNSTPLQPTKPSPSSVADSDQIWQSLKDINNATAAASSSPTIPKATTSSNIDDLLNNSDNLSLRASTVPVTKSLSIPTTATAAVAQEKVNATQFKFQNFDTELTELISGLKSNLTRETDESQTDLDDDKLLLYSDLDSVEPPADVSCDEVNHEPLVATQLPVETIAQPTNTNKRLADISIDFNTIRPHDVHGPRCIMDDKLGLKIVLNFTKDKPRDDVVLLVITTTNQHHLPVSNYQFEASVSKPCKLHLQEPSGHELSGVKPFRPPTEDITQILLISNAEKRPLKLVCIISYLLGDDPDPVKEFLEIDDLPDFFS